MGCLSCGRSFEDIVKGGCVELSMAVFVLLATGVALWRSRVRRGGREAGHLRVKNIRRLRLLQGLCLAAALVEAVAAGFLVSSRGCFVPVVAAVLRAASWLGVASTSTSWSIVVVTVQLLAAGAILTGDSSVLAFCRFVTSSLAAVATALHYFLEEDTEDDLQTSLLFSRPSLLLPEDEVSTALLLQQEENRGLIGRHRNFAAKVPLVEDEDEEKQPQSEQRARVIGCDRRDGKLLYSIAIPNESTITLTRPQLEKAMRALPPATDDLMSHAAAVDLVGANVDTLRLLSRSRVVCEKKQSPLSPRMIHGSSFDASVTAVAVVTAQGKMDTFRETYGTLASGRILYKIEVTAGSNSWSCAKTFAQLRALLSSSSSLNRPQLPASAEFWVSDCEARTEADAALGALLLRGEEDAAASLKLFLETDRIGEEAFDLVDDGDEGLRWVPITLAEEEELRSAVKDDDDIVLNKKSKGEEVVEDIGQIAFAAATMLVAILGAVGETRCFERVESRGEGGDGKTAYNSRDAKLPTKRRQSLSTPAEPPEAAAAAAAAAASSCYDDGSNGGVWVALARTREAVLHTTAWAGFERLVGRLQRAAPLPAASQRCATLLNLYGCLSVHATLKRGAGSGRPGSTARQRKRSNYAICGKGLVVSLDTLEAALLLQDEQSELSRAGLVGQSTGRLEVLAASCCLCSARVSGAPLAAYPPSPLAAIAKMRKTARKSLRDTLHLLVTTTAADPEALITTLTLPYDLGRHSKLIGQRDWPLGQQKKQRITASSSKRPESDVQRGAVEWAAAERDDDTLVLDEDDEDDEDDDDGDLFFFVGEGEEEAPAAAAAAASSERNVLDFLSAVGGRATKLALENANAATNTTTTRLRYGPNDMRPALRLLR